MKKTILATSALLTSALFLEKKKVDCCGIIGVVSKKQENVAPSLSLGVELLKNRGYDSAGVVTFANNDNKV